MEQALRGSVFHSLTKVTGCCRTCAVVGTVAGELTRRQLITLSWDAAGQ